MTIERWDDDRLDALGTRLEIAANIAESNVRMIQALANVAVEAREERQQLFERMDRQQANIEGLRIMIAEQQANMAEEHKIIMQQQDEIRGLQTENRRTLDILLNQRNQDDNPTN